MQRSWVSLQRRFRLRKNAGQGEIQNRFDNLRQIPSFLRPYHYSNRYRSFFTVSIMNDIPSSARNERDLLLATIDLPTTEREAYLQQACQDNPVLKARVLQLLQHADATGSFMAAPAVDLQATTPMQAFEMGGQIDRYRLMEQLGEGGMGIVFVAEQSEPVRRKVALKLIKPGMDSKAVIARFEAERQALALMDHPNIARVLDAGTTRERLPYFVMELVRGLPITQYCDQAKATIDQRLLLFIDVCNAVQHAHQKGIIHRDLKPSNILVTLHDGKPVVKVIDFGVAKALHQQLTQHTIYTALNQVVGTPLYMSPEQLELSGLDIDTRTDIYSLGVLLYELLSGTTPFDRDRLLKSGFDEMRRIIREEEPPRPSYRVTTMPQAQQSTFAERRGIDQRTFQRSIESELDWIVLKTLEKDRNRRYSSAADLGADVHRFLAHEIVLACPPSWSYTILKTMRKHRIAVATISLVLLSLLLGLIATSWQWRRAYLAEGKATAANQLAHDREGLANRRLKIAEDTIEVMYTEFAREWLGSQAGTSQRQSQFLHKAVAAFEQLAAEVPSDQTPRLGAIRANLRAGQMLNQLSDFDSALTRLSTANDMAAKALKVNSENIDLQLLVAQIQVSLASIYRSRGERASNIECTDKALSILTRLANRDDSNDEQKIEIAKGFSNCVLGFSAEKSRTEEAAVAAVESVRLARQLLNRDPGNVMLMQLLANSLNARGQQALWWGKENEVSEAAYAESIALKKKIVALAPDRIDVLLSIPGTLQNYGVVLGRLKRTEEGKKNTLERLALLRELTLRFPERPDLASQLGEVLRVAGNNEYRAGRTSEAWQLWNECETLLERVVKEHPDLSSARRSLALSLHQFSNTQKTDGNLEQSQETLTKCNTYIAEFIRQFPDDAEMHVIYQRTLRDLAILDLQLGHHERAFTSAQAILNSEFEGTLRERTTNRNVEDFQDHIGHLLGCVIPDMIASRCFKMAQDAESSPDIQARYQDFQLQCKVMCNKYLDDWKTNRPDHVKEWRELIERIDSEDAWKAHHRSSSLVNLYEDALLATQSVALKDYISSISKADEMPKHWSDVVLVAASSPKFCESREQIVEFASRGFAMSNTAPHALRAMAWLTFRKGDFQQCINNLDTLGQQPDDEFVRAMALKKLGRDADAIRTLELAKRFVVENEVELTERLKKESVPGQPNIQTYRRLQAEAEQLILPAPDASK